jgi:hypothetical protein
MVALPANLDLLFIGLVKKLTQGLVVGLLVCFVLFCFVLCVFVSAFFFGWLYIYIANQRATILKTKSAKIKCF